MAPPLSPTKFREESEARLIDAFGVMGLAGLRSREGVNSRMKAGTLPQPVYQDGRISLWDREDVVAHTQSRGDT